MLFILITEFVDAALNFVPKVSALFISPSSSPGYYSPTTGKHSVILVIP